MRNVFILVIGLAIGYFVGYNDARKHTKHVVERTLDKIGVGARKNLNNSADSRLQGLER